MTLSSCAPLRERHVIVMVLAALTIPISAIAQSTACPANAPATTSLITVREQDRNGAVYSVCGAGRTKVDIESTILIDPNLAALANPGSSIVVESAEIRQLQIRAQVLATMLHDFSDQLPAITAQIERAATAVARAPGDVASQQQLKAVLNAHAGLLQPVIVTLRKLDPTGVEAALGSTDPAYSGLGEVLRRQIMLIDTELSDAVRKVLAHKQAYIVQLFAVRRGAGRAPVQVHLDGYDNLSAGDPRPIDRLAFTRTPEEAAAMASADATNTLLANLINDARDNHRTLGEGVRQRVQAWIDDAKALRALVENVPTATSIDALAASLATPALTPVATALRDVKSSLPSITGLQRVSAELAAPPDVTSPMVALDDVLHRGTVLAATLKSIKGTLDSLKAFQDKVKAVDAAAAAAATTATSDDKAVLTAARMGDIARWLELSQQVQGHVASLTQSITAMEDLARSLGVLGGAAAANVSGAPLRLELQSVNAELARPTSLDLTTVDERDGDHIVVTYRIQNRDGTVTLASEERTLEIQTFGLYRRWSGALAFTRLDASEGFRAGASASYLLHYRSRPDKSTGVLTRKSRFWHAVDPGLGLTSVVTSGKSNVELGIGPTVSILRDFLQGSYGYNLQQQKWYLLFSTPLLDVVQRLNGQGADLPPVDPR